MACVHTKKKSYTKSTSGALARMLIFQCYAYLPDVGTLIRTLEKPSEAYNNLVYIDPVREPSSISKHIEPNQSVFILPASDYTSDDYQSRNLFHNFFLHNTKCPSK